MEWMFMPLRRYADFEGRSCRMEYWMFQLFIIITIAALALLFVVLPGDNTTGGLPIVGIILIVLFFLGIFVPALAVQIRRFHDQDKSGWFTLLGLIPYVGGIVVFVFMCLPGSRGPNRFGNDPLGGA